MTPSEARQVLRGYINPENKWFGGVKDFSDIHFRKDGVLYTSHYYKDGDKEYKCSHRFDEANSMDATKAPLLSKLLVFRYEPVCGFLLAHDDAVKFTNAVRVLRDHAAGKPNPKEQKQEEAFQAKADAWKTLKQKPPLSERIRQYKIMAESAFQQKRFEDAIAHYDKALAIEPLWATGLYNSALISAELGRYDEAIVRMKRYLAIVSDQNEARLARDKIYMWTDRSEAGTN